MSSNIPTTKIKSLWNITTCRFFLGCSLDRATSPIARSRPTGDRVKKTRSSWRSSEFNLCNIIYILYYIIYILYYIISMFWLFDHPAGSERQHGHGVFFPGRGCARTPQPQRWMPSGDRPSCLKEVPLAVVLNPTMVTYPVRWYHDTLLIDYIFDMLSWLVHIPIYIQKNVEIIRHNPIPRS